MYKNDNKQTAERASEQKEKQPIFTKTIDSQGWYTVQSDLIRYYDELGITEKEFLFLNALMVAEKKEGGASVIRIKLKTVAEWLGTSEEWAVKTGRELEKKGYIKRWRKNRRLTYNYSLKGLHEHLAACIEKDPGRSRKSKFFFMPSFFIHHFGRFREQYEIGPREFVLLSLFMSYHKAPRKDEISHGTIQKYLGWPIRKIKRAIDRLEQRPEATDKDKAERDPEYHERKSRRMKMLSAEQGENGNYRFHVEPFLAVLSLDIKAWKREEKREEKAVSAPGENPNPGGQKVQVEAVKKFRSTGQKVQVNRSKSSGPIKYYPIITTPVNIILLNYYPETPKKSAPVIVNRTTKMDQENRPESKEPIKQETARRSSADQEHGQEIQAYDEERAYQEWIAERFPAPDSEKAKQEEEKRIQQRMDVFLNQFFPNENLDASTIRSAVQRDPISKTAYHRLIAKGLVPPHFLIHEPETGKAVAT